MSFSLSHPYAVAATFLWIGFVGAISFMESWLKFQAPGVNLSIGLGIGKRVFQALNYVELFFALSVLASFLFSSTTLFSTTNLPYLIAFLIVVLQYFWFLPALDERATLIIAGETPEKSFLHFYYVGLEIIKIACLIYFGIKLLKL